eukprot:4232706-Pyramimonas_sp.AAC.1
MLVTKEVATGPWSDDDKALIAAALSNAACDPQDGGLPRAQQTFKGPHNFLSASEWVGLQDMSLSFSAKLQIISNRTWRAGVSCPGQKAQARGVAPAVTMSPGVDVTTATSQTFVAWMKQFQSNIKRPDA